MAEAGINTDKTDTYEFGEFRLNTGLRALYRGQEGVEIQKRVLDLLIFLIENRDRTVSKDELQAAVWPGTIVTEAALSRAVMKARKALEDDATEQRFIKTVHGQGYRFAAEVGVAALDEVQAEQQEQRLSQRRQALLRVATTYGAGAWLLNQAASMVWEAFDWDRWPQQLLLAVSLVGFPIVLAFTWFYKATADGVALRTERAALLAPQTRTRGRDRIVIGMLALALILSVTWNLRDEIQPQVVVDRVAVLPIHNETSDASLNWISLGMMSLVNSQLSSADIPVVQPQKVLRNFPEPVQISHEQLDLLRKAEAARYVVDLRIETSGSEFVARGQYFDRGEATAIGPVMGESPSQAANQWTRALVDALAPSQTRTVEVDYQSGDLFVDQAFARGMHEILSGNLEQGRDLLEVAANAQPDAFEPSYELNVVKRQLGDLPGAKSGNLETLERLRAVLENAGLDNPRARAAARQIGFLSNELGIIADLQGELDQSASHYEEGLHWAVAIEDHDRRAVLLINYAILERARGNAVRQRELLGQASMAYSDAGIELLPGDFYLTLGNTDADSGDIEGARDQYRKALENYRAMDRARGEGIALSNLSWASQRLGDIPAAFSYLEQSEALRERIGDRVGVLKSQVRRADLAYEVGEFEQALLAVSQIVDAEYAQQEEEILATALNIQAAVYANRGQHTRAVDLLQQARVMDEAGGRRHGTLRAYVALARSFIALTQFDDAQATLDTVLAQTQDGTLPIFRAQALLELGTLEVARGRTMPGIEFMKQAADEARTHDNNPFLATAAARIANVYFEEQDLQGVETWAGVAWDTDPADPRAQLAQAQLALLKHNPTRAAQLLDRAAAASGERHELKISQLRTYL